MAPGDFLRIIYNDMDAVLYSKYEGKVASRRFTRENGRLIIEFLDRYNDRVAYASETFCNGEPEVEFRDRHGSHLGYTRLASNLLRSPSIHVCWQGTEVKEIRITDEQIDRIKGKSPRSEVHKADRSAESHSETAAAQITTQTNTTVPNQDPAVPLLLTVMVLLTFGLQWLFSAFYNNLGSIIYFAANTCVKFSCSLMVVLFLCFCRIEKTAPRELQTFCRWHLLLYTGSFLFLAWLHAGVYDELGVWPFRFSPYNLILIPGGFPHLFLCFSPIFINGLISGIWTLRMKKRGGAFGCERISRMFMRLLQTGSLIFITVTQYTMLFYSSYVPNNFGNIFLMILLTAFMGLLILLVWAVAKTPYGISVRQRNK